MTLGFLYLGLLALGVCYALITGLLGWLADFGGDADFDAGDGGHLHPVSGTTVATFITGFGGGGTVAHYFLDWSTLPGLALATGSGIGLAGAAFLVLDLLFRHTQGGSEFVVTEMTGREAEVITAIPEGGAGEIAFVARGQRESGKARSTDGKAIPRGSLVVIETVMGSTMHVRTKE